MEEQIKAVKAINNYPIGTKYPSINGGYWIKTGSNHFKWCTGNTFPSVGGDWNGKVILPKTENFKFTTPCFIRKNNEYLRIALEELGYVRDENDELDDNTEECFIYTFKNKYALTCLDFVVEDEIDCGENEELFLAIAALRIDSDYKQWFVNKEPNQWVNQGLYQPSGPNSFCLVDKFYDNGNAYHKASVEELIEKFK